MKFAYATGDKPLPGYTVKRGIGVGGFGEVYFALSDGGKEVALKRIQRNLDVELRGVGHCLNLKHPNLLALYDIRRDDADDTWVIMEYVAGDSLAQALERTPSGMPAAEALDWFRGLVAGAAYLHDHGIVHRDLKPANIFRDEGVVKLGDYGLAKFISCSRRSGHTESVGTCHYMAPEIGQGRYGKEIDIYALGVILYEMLTGRVPFEGESAQEVIMKHLTAQPNLADVPENLRGVVAKALAKDPEQRFHTATEMLTALEAAANGSPIPVAASPGVFVISDNGSGIQFGREQPGPGFVPTSLADAQAVPLPQGEPIARAAAGAWKKFMHWWNDDSLNQSTKIVLLALVVVALSFSAPYAMPLVVLGGIGYLIYLAVYSFVTAVSPAPATTPAYRQPVPLATPQPVRGWHVAQNPKRWQERARELLRGKSRSRRVSELFGSMLKAIPLAAVVSLLVLLLGGVALDGSAQTWTLYAWLVTTTVGGAWATLAPAKLWEGRSGEQVWRRFAMLVMGIVLGSASWASSDQLLVDWSGTGHNGPVRWVSDVFEKSSTPDAAAFIAYFAIVFAALRWWRQADALRPNRLSLWTAASCALWAWVVQWFWNFPQPWGVMLVAAISVVVQLSAPLFPADQRALLRREQAAT